MKKESDLPWQEYVKTRNPELKEKIILEYIYLVKNIANKVSFYLPVSFIKEDLFGYGIFGLLEAVERYNPGCGVPFPGYALKRIKGSIIDGIRKEDWVPASVRRKAKLISQAYHKIENELLRSATDEELAAELNISVPELTGWFKQTSYVTLLSLDEPLQEASSALDNLPDQHNREPLAEYERKEIEQILIAVLDDLPEKERLVVALFYYEGLTNKEIAGLLKVSASRVSQLHTKAIFRLRGKLARHKQYFS